MLEVKSLTVSVADQQVCNNLNFTAHPGEFWAVLGRNGSGKTTLLHTLAGLRKANAGQVLVDNKPLSAWPRRALAQQLGILLQDSEDVFPSPLLESALAGRHAHLNRWQEESAEDLNITRQALKEMELNGRENLSTHVLSGGERRRLALATLFTQSPNIMLLDEPINHLDVHHQVRALESVARRVHDGTHIALAVLHDLNLAARFCNRIMMLHDDGNILTGPTEALLTSEQLSQLYRHPIHAVKTAHGAYYVMG